jgi:hypothetical protein
MTCRDSFPEVAELEVAAELRLRQVDADPGDLDSAGAARALQALADDLRRRQTDPLLEELHALCNWLAESDNISDFAWRAHALRGRIGVDLPVVSGEEYVRMLIELAKDCM